MRVNKAWSQDVVLKAMCDDIAKQRNESATPDFVLATGDLAFSGNAKDPLPVRRASALLPASFRLPVTRDAVAFR
jgi:hypothetical protein